MDTLDGIAEDLAGRFRALDDPGLVAAIDERLEELPGEVAEVVRPPGDDGAVIISGLRVDDARLGPTPAGWREAGETGVEFSMILLLLARAAGEPFGWRGQQEGRLVNSIVPARGQEVSQTGASSATTLAPHTEDAFHPRRANLLLLGCLRNPDRVGTTVASVRRARLDHDQLRLLAEPALPILPDTSYGGEHDPAAAPGVPTIWGGPDGLTLRYDPAYTPLERATPDHRAAYARLSTELDRVSVTAALGPGELLMIDNDVAVHGRVPFRARYDGTDRWLKRINVRLRDRPRRQAEAAEDGYGEQLVEPYRDHAA
ncbi:TauD/TfdA family dioxygenase [Microlunatus sp. GCM10028923]|uniref:TauD/TfdA family dioxygenase n=1 Tax=Microlunatus sp. GCM10028923 TaxID=3273400 RepID=UPI0036130E4F